mgnify:CR=1 FL=1
MINAESVRMMKSPIAGHRESTAVAFDQFKGAKAIDALVLINTVLEDVVRLADTSNDDARSKDRIISTAMACGKCSVNMDDYQGLIDLYHSEMWNYFHITWPTSNQYGRVKVVVDNFAHQRMTVID